MVFLPSQFLKLLVLTPIAATLEREQFYLNLLFANVSNSLILNLARTSVGVSTFSHTEEFKKGRIGANNPMFGRTYSPEFLAWQKADKRGPNNPQWGVIKKLETVAKLTKLVYVFDASSGEQLGKYSTVICKKTYKIGYDTLKRCIETGETYKGKIFTRNNNKLTNVVCLSKFYC